MVRPNPYDSKDAAFATSEHEQEKANSLSHQPIQIPFQPLSKHDDSPVGDRIPGLYLSHQHLFCSDETQLTQRFLTYFSNTVFIPAL